MKNRNARRYFGGVFTAVMFLALSVFFTGGCGGGSDDHAVIARAYYIGEGWEGLALYLKRYCIDFLPYDGESTDGLLFVSYGDDFVPSDGDIKSIKRAYEAGCFVVLVHATMDRANEFLGHIGLPPHFDIEGDGGEQKLVEILAVYRQQRDDGGTDIFTWVTPEYTAPVKSESASDDDPAKKPPLPEDDFDPDEFNEARTRHFVQYVVDEEKRLEDAERAREFAKAAVSSATDDLTRIAQAQIITRDASKYKQHFMINYYIYSCHSYNAADGVDYDWFVVQQRAMLNPQNNYAKKDAHDEYLAKVTGYMVHYDFENTLDDINGVQLVNTSPASTSGSTSVTSGFSWSLGGDVGVSGSSPSMNLSGSVTYSSSETVEIADCTVTNSSAPWKTRSFGATRALILEPPARALRATRRAGAEPPESNRETPPVFVLRRLVKRLRAHGLAASYHNPVRLRGNTVGDGLRRDGYRNLVQPLGRIVLGCDDGGLAVVSAVDQREQEPCILLGDREQKPVVQNQKVYLDKLLEQPVVCLQPLVSGHLELLQHVGQLKVLHGRQLPAGGLPQRLRQVGLSGAGRSGDDDVAGVPDIVARRQLQDEVAVQTPVVVVPYVLDAGGGVREIRSVHQALQPVASPSAELPVDEKTESVAELHLAVAGVLLLLLQCVGDASQPHAPELAHCLVVKHYRDLRSSPRRGDVLFRSASPPPVRQASGRSFPRREGPVSSQGRS